MSDTLQHVRLLVAEGKLRVSRHGYNELAADGLFFEEIVIGAAAAVVVEDYPTYPKGPCVLVRQMDASGAPIHVLWGIPAGRSEPAVLITAYRPDPARWDASFLRRKP